MMARLAMISLIVALSSLSWARSKMTTSSERGFVSLGAIGGTGQADLLNADGSLAGYRNATLYGGELDLRIWGQGPGELHLFGRYTSTTYKNVDDETNQLSRKHTLAGLKGYVGDWTYVGLGWGNSVDMFQTSTADFSLTNSGPSLGMGVEIPISDNFAIGLHAWYHSHPVKYESPLLSNSHLSAGEAFLSLVWTPPMTVINMTMMSDR